MAKPNQNKKSESLEKKEAKNCPRLDGGYCLDKEACLVKKQYGSIDGEKLMDAGIMLK